MMVTLGVFALITSGCGQTKKEQATTNENETSKISIENIEDCVHYESFSLDSFPKEWVNLTMYENRYVIYESCDAGNQLWRFSKNDEKYELLMYGTQEDYIFDIVKSYISNDTIFLESRCRDFDEIKNFKILWDKDKHFIQTLGDFDTWDLFVENKNASDYEVYIQPCRECWDDECDEIEKLEEN